MELPQDFNALLQAAESQNLYQALIDQLNKDIAMANQDLQFDHDIPATSLIYVLKEFVFDLLENREAEFLNLLYIIDVPEKKMATAQTLDEHERLETVCLLILQRVWQKVWYKNQYG